MDQYSDERLGIMKTELLNELEDELASKLSHNSYRKVMADMEMLMRVSEERGKRERK